MSWTLVGTPDNRSVATGQTSWTVTAGTVGNLRLLTTNILSSSNQISSLSGGGVNNWQQGAFLQDGTQGRTLDIWWGMVTDTGTSLTITFQSAIGSTSVQQNRFDFSSDGRGGAMTLQAHGTLTNASSTTITYPSLTPTAPDQLYFGTCRNGGSTPSAGSTTGFSYNIDAQNNVQPYNLNCAVSAQQPTATDGTAGASLTVAVIIGKAPPSGTYGQAVNRATTY